jgi:hypothetical protein
MSINKITYLSQFVDFKFFVFTNLLLDYFYFADLIELKLFLRKLEVGKCYVLIFLSEFDDDTPVITLCDPILVTSNSNPTLLSKFILNRLSIADDRFDLEYEILRQMRLDKAVPYIRVKYNEINLFPLEIHLVIS